MKIDVSKLSYSKPTSIKEEVSFDPEKFVPTFPLKSIKKTLVNAKVTRYDDFINVALNIKADVTLISSYSLKEFDATLSGEDELNFVSVLNEFEEDEELILYRGNFIELDEFIFNLLSASVPLKPIIEGEEAPKSGKNYRVISDEEAQKEKLEKGDARFSKLDELEFD